MRKRLIRLLGGHRNKVFLTDGRVKIVWKDGFKREKQIREGVLLENFVAVHTGIKSRMLVDKSKPVEEENGELVTYFNYVQGEIRYPWNLEEIASAAKLLTKFHSLFPGAQKVQPFGTERLHLIRLHLDFARGNVLFQPRTAIAVGVIDFETTVKGPVEQELGRTLSFLLVDSPSYLSLRGVPTSRRDDVAISTIRSPRSFQSLAMTFRQRFNTFLINYPLPFTKDDVVNWTLRYLTEEDYGDLNNIRDKVLNFLSSSRA